MIKRTMYLEKLEMYLNRDVVKIITGVRRCGKTTLIRQFIEELKENGIPEENIIYLNFEAMIYAYFNRASDLRDMLFEFMEQSKGHTYIFLDEVQNIEGWANVASELLNLFDCDLYVSSSNSSVFKNDFAKVLGYRYVRIDVFPLTFSEYLAITAEERIIPEGSEAQAPSKEELFMDYLRRGSMPGTYSLKDDADRTDYLSDLYNAIILKDVVQCNNLRDINHIDKIMEFILSHMGEVFSPKAVKDHVKKSGAVISVDTVYSCLDALTGAYLIYKVPRFDIKNDRVLETQEKYYICDPAMRDSVMKDEGPGIEAMLENALCLEMLQRGFSLYVGKQGQNIIDFMAMRGQDRTYLNCCETVSDRTEAKNNFGPLTRIRDNYFKMVLSMDSGTIINKGGIINYPIVDFLSES